MKYSASILFLASLAISPAYAIPLEVSGCINMDAQAPFKPEDAPNNFYVSKVRIDIKGEWTPSWSYKLRIERPARPFASEDTLALIPSAVVTWKLYDGQVKANLGKDTPRYSQAGTDAQSYIERSIGVLEDSIGQKLGTNMSGVYKDTFGYSLGVWSATARASVIDYSYSVIPFEDDLVQLDPSDIDSVSTPADPTVSFNQHSIRPAFGGRVNTVLVNNNNIAWGAGIGVQSLDVIVPMVATYTDANANNAVYHTTIEKRLAYTVDQSFGWKKFTFNTAYHHFNYYRDNNASLSSDQIPDGVNAFQSHNDANSFYIELTRLVIGEGYKIDPACGVVNKVIPDEKYGSVELAIRFGQEHYYNAAAAQFLKSSFNGNASVPMTFTKESGYNLVTLTTSSDDFVVRAKGYTVSASYVMNKNIAFKSEFYSIKTSAKSQDLWNTLEKEQGLRLRSEFSF